MCGGDDGVEDCSDGARGGRLHGMMVNKSCSVLTCSGVIHAHV